VDDAFVATHGLRKGDALPLPLEHFERVLRAAAAGRHTMCTGHARPGATWPTVADGAMCVWSNPHQLELCGPWGMDSVGRSWENGARPMSPT
jgi:hypothetical protein